MIIIIKSHNNYCSVAVMELCLLNLLILGDCFLCSSYHCVLFESFISTRNHMFIREIWRKFTSFIFWNFEISLVSLRRFQNFKKVNSVNLSQISLLNMWLLVQILTFLHSNRGREEAIFILLHNFHPLTNI